jgi:hypothetical protein
LSIFLEHKLTLLVLRLILPPLPVLSSLPLFFGISSPTKSSGKKKRNQKFKAANTDSKSKTNDRKSHGNENEKQTNKQSSRKEAQRALAMASEATKP